MTVNHLTAFYHIGCLNHWKEVVAEQLDIYAEEGLPVPLYVGMVCATMDDVAWFEDQALRHRIPCRLLGAWSEADLFEFPTMLNLEAYCRNGGEGGVLYFHTKGVSQPSDSVKQAWRHLMNREVLQGWRTCVGALRAGYDLVGVNWRHNQPKSHFAGNFWWATCDWIRGLTDFEAYYDRADYPRWWGPEKRWGAEFWISASKRGKVPRVKSLVGQDVDFTNPLETLRLESLSRQNHLVHA